MAPLTEVMRNKQLSPLIRATPSMAVEVMSLVVRRTCPDGHESVAEIVSNEMWDDESAKSTD